MIEQWLPLKEYEGLYEISNLGRIKSLARHIKAKNNSSRYSEEKILKEGKVYSLYKNGVSKQRYINKLLKNTIFNYAFEDIIKEYYDLGYNIRLIKENFVIRSGNIIIYKAYSDDNILKTIYYGPEFEIAEWNGHAHQPIPECDSWIYLVQYNAGAEGWNSIKTDTLVFYSQNYSYKVMVQASGRIDRLNTPFRDLYYYHLKSKAPIDIGIGRALKEKKKFNETRFIKW